MCMCYNYKRKGMRVLSRVKVQVLLKENDEIKINRVISGILCNNIIKYNDGIVNIYDFGENVLRRKAFDYEIVLDFGNDRGMFMFQGLEIPFSLKLIDRELFNNGVCIKYLVCLDDFENVCLYRLEYEVEL